MLTPPHSHHQAVEIKIPTTDVWANTGYQVREGCRYSIAVKDMSKVWDSGIRVQNLQGWPSFFKKVLFSPLFWTRRSPFNPWFSVIATVDRNHPRRLTEEQYYIAPVSGELICYFNDAPFAYGNNSGTAILTITPQP